MSYSLSVQQRGEVLWVAATGTRSFETVLAMSKDIMSACAEKGARKVGIDVRQLQGRLAPLDSFEIVDRHFPAIQSTRVITQAAIVDLREFEARYRFFEDLAVNRGFNLRVFPEPGPALAWLAKDPP